MTAPSAGGRTAIVVKGYPRLSETFIAQEILGLQQRGQRQLIVSLRHPTDSKVHAINRKITAAVLYLPEYLHDEPRPGHSAPGAGPGPSRATRRPASPFCATCRATRQPQPGAPLRPGDWCWPRELPGDVDWLHCHYPAHARPR